MGELLEQYNQLRALLREDPNNAELLSAMADLRQYFAATGQSAPPDPPHDENKSRTDIPQENVEEEEYDSDDIFADVGKNKKRRPKQQPEQGPIKKSTAASVSKSALPTATAPVPAPVAGTPKPPPPAPQQLLEIKVTGANIPKPISTWEEAKLPPTLRQAIAEAQFTHPSPVQQYSLPILLGRRDLMATAQTGSGKTGAFLIPMIADVITRKPPKTAHFYRCFPLCIILVPTRELAAQVHQETLKLVRAAGLRSAAVYGGIPYDEQMKEVDTACEFLTATPGRLADMLAKEKVSLTCVQHVCLDEADRMLEMGFEVQLRAVLNHADLAPPTKRVTCMFSATFPKQIRALATEFMNDPAFLKVSLPLQSGSGVGSSGSGGGGGSSSITQVIKFVDNASKEKTLIADLAAAKASRSRTLVFVERKKMAGDLNWILNRRGFPSEALHGNRTQAEREAALEAFKQGRINILVATGVAERGLHIDGVEHVINYELPASVDEYIHRIGRTGRAGASGLATSYFNHQNAGIVTQLVRFLKQSGQVVPLFLDPYVPPPPPTAGPAPRNSQQEEFVVADDDA